MSEKHHWLAGVGKLAAVVAGAAAFGMLLPGSVVAVEPTPGAKAVTPPTIAGVPGLPGPLAAPAKPAQNMTLLKATPDVARAGTKFTLTGSALPANRDLDIVWHTVRGSYVLNSSPEVVEHAGRQFDPIAVVLAKARTDGGGQFSVNLTAPADYGELHDIYAVSAGVQLAKGGFRLKRAVTITPTKGPIGTPITIKVMGLGWKPFESTASVLYDNKYAGYISATTTRGTATVQIRASGPVGPRVIEVGAASHAVNYLNIEQSPVYFVGKYRFVFRVTKDNGPPPATLDWPAKVTPTVSTRTTLTGSAAAGVSASLAGESGPVLSKVELTARGLAPGAADIQWGTAVGARAHPSGWSLTSMPLSKAQVGASGELATTVTIPDNLGGWHAVQIVQGGKVKAELPYFVERSLVSVKPLKVKRGQPFTIQVKGIGWTELDNGFAVTYDNGYIGYACGFNSNGDVTMDVVATGGPGTHLIELYPMIYKGKINTDIWSNEIPMLSFKQDAPGLALGYRLPVFRLAIEVVP